MREDVSQRPQHHAVISEKCFDAAEQKIDAIYIESGTSMYYFTGMRWGQSERMFALVIPQRGELAWVCPKFEEERARELIKIGTGDIRTWEEDESPYRRVAQIIRDRG